ncbi:MAG TPA: tetratricopeptide repeat protein [Candidatus Xenobia bacterium]|jgi:tetratricopeptide (TPR) repeat protein
MSPSSDGNKGGDKAKAAPRTTEKPLLGGAPTHAGGMMRKPSGHAAVVVEEEGGSRRTRMPPKHFEKHQLGDVIGNAPEQLALVEDELKANPQDADLHMRRYHIVKQHGERQDLLVVLADALEFCHSPFFAGRLAALHEEDEHYDKALHWRDEATRWAPEDGEAWRRLALASLKTRDLERAEAAWRKLVDLRPHDDHPLGNNFLEEVTGAGLSASKRAAVQDMGLRVLQHALQDRPDHPPLLEDAARLAARAGDLESSAQSYEKLLRLASNHPQARMWKTELLRVYGRIGWADKWKGLSDQLIADYGGHLATTPKDGRSWRFLGRQYIQAGRNEEAVRALKQATSCDNQDWQSVYELGRLLVKMGRSDEAVKYYEDILDPFQNGGPERKSVRRALEKSLADLYFRMGRYKESLEIYNRDEEANARFIAPLFEAVSDFDRALQQYQKTLKQTPVDAEAYLKLAEYHVRRGNWGEAEPIARRGLGCKNAYGDTLEGLWVALATTQMMTNQMPEAMATIDEAINHSPDSPSLLFRKVKLLLKNGRQQEGNELAETVRDMLRKQIDCAPADSNLWSLLGDAHSLLRQPDQAELAFSRALQYDQMDATAWRGLGAMCEKKKDLAMALDCYRRFVLLDPIHLSTHPVRQKVSELEAQLGQGSTPRS